MLSPSPPSPEGYRRWRSLWKLAFYRAFTVQSDQAYGKDSIDEFIIPKVSQLEVDLRFIFAFLYA